MTFDDNYEDIAVSEFLTEETSKVDEDIQEVEDASEDITAGHSITDGDMIDAVALDDAPQKIDPDVANMVDDSEEDPVKALNRSVGDPTDADYVDKYPELHNEDPTDPAEMGEDLTEDDMLNAVDESCLDGFTIEAIMEGLQENEQEEG